MIGEVWFGVGSKKKKRGTLEPTVDVKITTGIINLST